LCVRATKPTTSDQRRRPPRIRWHVN
jgi:hypothetical protein